MTNHYFCAHCSPTVINGVLSCPVDGKNANWHADANYCPKDPPLFGLGIKPPLWDERETPPMPIVELTDEQVEQERQRVAAGGCCGSPAGE